MITLTKSGDTINFTFSNSDHYLYGNGTISVPTNSLSLTIDESDMVTFKKTNNDIFISATLGEFNKTKAELIEFYKDNMVGGGGMSSGDVESMISSAISGKADTSAVTESLNAKVDTSAFTSYSGSIESRLSNDEEVTAAALNDLNETISGKVDTSAVTTSVTSGSTDAEIPTAKAVYDAIPTGGTSITIDQTLDSGSTNPVANSAITTAINSKISKNDIVQDYYGTVCLNTSDKRVYNTSIMIGRSYIDNKELAIAIGTTQKNVAGGAKIYGGGGIGIGNDVVTKASYGVTIGLSSSAGTSDNQWACVAIGTEAESYGNYATSFSRTKSTNESEFSCGKFNNSVSASTTFGDSGNTLFSVGNGTSTNARHNAFEIRQNGDIYCSDGTNDVKLQDTITATTANTTALGGLSLVKLTQSAYDNLLVKDSMTLYVITDS